MSQKNVVLLGDKSVAMTLYDLDGFPQGSDLCHEIGTENQM